MYTVATPIGNIFDISLRAIHILRKSHLIFAEDTRNSRKLLSFYEINVPLVSCHEYNEISNEVVKKIERGKIYSLISDAGTPMISDPGFRLVNWCVQNDIDVFPIPGACAFIAGLSAAGLPTDSFTFCGFLPPKLHARTQSLISLKDRTETLVFLESPKRMIDCLKNMLDVFGDRICCICREITKIYENFYRGNLAELINYFDENEPVGEFVIIVSGAKSEQRDEEDAFTELATLLQTYHLKEAVNVISDKYRMSKKIVYQKAVKLKNESNGI